MSTSSHGHQHHGHGHKHEHGRKHAPKPACCSHHPENASVNSDAEVRDPVCGMRVDPSETPHHAEHDGETYHFCSAGCRGKFVADPEKYLQSGETEPVVAPPGAQYTCPMHPEIVQDHPGNCPKCGMALEPMLPGADDGDSPELVDFRRRFWWTLPLTLAVLVLAMAGPQLPLEATTRTWLELVLATPVVLWAAWPFFVRWAQSIRNRSPNMWTLIGTGVGAAYLYSVVATVAPDLFPASFHEHGRVGVYYEAAAVIVSLTLLGQLLELRARSKTSEAVKALRNDLGLLWLVTLDEHGALDFKGTLRALIRNSTSDDTQGGSSIFSDITGGNQADIYTLRTGVRQSLPAGGSPAPPAASTAGGPPDEPPPPHPPRQPDRRPAHPARLARLGTPRHHRRENRRLVDRPHTVRAHRRPHPARHQPRPGRRPHRRAHRLRTPRHPTRTTPRHRREHRRREGRATVNTLTLASLTSLANHISTHPQLDRIGGHYHYAETGCPGRHLRRHLEDGTLRRMVAERLSP